MITDLWIENFKGIGKRQHIPLRPIRLLFGANNSGKSTVVMSLVFLREIIENHECDPEVAKSESNVEFGGFENLSDIEVVGRVGAADESAGVAAGSSPYDSRRRHTANTGTISGRLGRLCGR